VSLLNWKLAALTSLALTFTPAAQLTASAQNAVFNIPPVKIPLEFKDRPLTVTASARLTLTTSKDHTRTLNLELTGDLSDLQTNLTPLLSAQLDKDEHCGDRITIQSASLTPADPASQALIQLHVERWACVKALGKQVAKRLIGGDAQIPIKLTPAIAEDGTGLQLVPEVGEIQANGSLGELLRSGLLGNTIRDKIHNTILTALQKATNFKATLPPAIQDNVTIRNAEFKDSGDGRLLVVLEGEAHLTQEQTRLLSDQVKQRLAGR
jgi:hypothetical protein